MVWIKFWQKTRKSLLFNRVCSVFSKIGFCEKFDESRSWKRARLTSVAGRIKLFRKQIDFFYKSKLVSLENNLASLLFVVEYFINSIDTGRCSTCLTADHSNVYYVNVCKFCLTRLVGYFSNGLRKTRDIKFQVFVTVFTHSVIVKSWK